MMYIEVKESIKQKNMQFKMFYKKVYWHREHKKYTKISGDEPNYVSRS